MGALGAAARLEFQQVRDRIADRIAELEDHVSYGTLSYEEKERILAEEFGEDYLAILRELNYALHLSRPEKPVLPHLSLATLLLFVLTSITIIAALVTPGILGMGTAEHGTIRVNTELLATQTMPIPITVPARITHVEASAGTYTLLITDAEKTRILLVQNEHGSECISCGERLLPPYTLELRGPEATVHRIRYEVAR